MTFELFKKGYSGQGLRLQHLLSGLWNSHSKEEHCTFSTWVLQNPIPLTAMSNLDVWMRYRNKNLILPMCAKEGDHLAGSPEFCTLSVFQRVRFNHFCILYLVPSAALHCSVSCSLIYYGRPFSSALSHTLCFAEVCRPVPLYPLILIIPSL